MDKLIENSFTKVVVITVAVEMLVTKQIYIKRLCYTQKEFFTRTHVYDPYYYDYLLA